MPLLSVNQLAISFANEQGKLNVIEDVSFNAERGETIGLVGESGCGKSITAMAIMGLLPQPHGKLENGTIHFDQQALIHGQYDAIRGKKIAMIFQEPMTALNPVHRIGRQLDEVFRLHQKQLNKQARKDKCINLLERVGIPSPEKRLNDYPHQLSGGMRQRVMIAMALACEPQLLIADEPTTALDVTIQAQILELIKTLQKENGMSVIMISHDLGVIAETCDRVLVMYAGRLIEQASVKDLLTHARHPYTQGLLDAIPTLEQPIKKPLKTIPGNVPSLNEFSAGCRFANRCSYKTEQCTTTPQLEAVKKPSQASSLFERTHDAYYDNDHKVACWHWREIAS